MENLFRQPGPALISGWAAVHQGNVAEIDAATAKLKYDFYYVKYFSPWLHLLIAAKTVKILFTVWSALKRRARLGVHELCRCSHAHLSEPTPAPLISGWRCDSIHRSGAVSRGCGGFEPLRYFAGDAGHWLN